MSWQEKLDQMFPDGLLVTFVEQGNPPGFAEDAPTYFAARLDVVEEGEQPMVRFMLLDYSRDYTFRFTRLEEFTAPGVWVAYTRDPAPDLMLSRNLGPETKKRLQEARAKMYPSGGQGA